ncbi:MAG: amidophosphoribosyltransferase [Parasporobacterium sp.]|nr:amidophosphoribosyltransferase [Parasporobacterium sp.]
MGGFFGITSKKDCVLDVYFGTDYHSHLGKYRAGMASVDPERGFEREIHNIENSPFRTKFDNISARMKGTGALGVVSDYDTQPLLIKSRFGVYAIAMVGVITNCDKLVEEYMSEGAGVLQCMSGNKINYTELLASLIDRKSDFTEGIKYACSVIEGSANILILKENGDLVAARDRFGRLPIVIGKGEDGYAASSESFAFEKLGYTAFKELAPGEIVNVSPDCVTVLEEGTGCKKICAFLWTYYGFPTTSYEGQNVEIARMRNGHIMARNEIDNGTLPDVDYVAGVPDSGIAHALGFASESRNEYARPFVKYTPTWARSFIPTNQTERSKVAKMKQVPVSDVINGKKLLFVDDSIVRGTQLRETVELIYSCGAKEVHMRSACPPIMYPCKYLNFSRSNSEMDLITRRIIFDLEGEEGIKYLDEYADGTTERGKKLRNIICEQMHFDSLEFQTLDGLVEAIGLKKCDLCTYCWDGVE